MSNVVKLHYETEHIAVVTMDDKATGNCFSPELVQGVLDCYVQIRNKPQTKVLILHGEGKYFCCGGTKEMLLELSNGNQTFNDLDFYQCLTGLSDFEFPTIASMEGHALGGGLTFGLYADFIVLAEESVYSANFMRYGFTPGVAATHLVPEKLGLLLGNEMLFTARNYQGYELKERNVAAPVVKKANVFSYALSLAKEIADKPLISLKVLKKHLTRHEKEEHPLIIASEVEMHKQTFHSDEVKSRIEKFFGK